MAGLVLEGWLSTSQIRAFRAASTGGYDSYSRAVRAYSVLVYERTRYPTPPILLEDSEGSLLPEEEESDEESAVVVSDEDDTWERAFSSVAD